MTISQSHMSYSDCYDAMNRALDDSQGVRIEVGTENEAIFFRMRCHKARAIDRRRNAEAYASDHPMHNASLYDPLVLRIRQNSGRTWIYIEQQGLHLGEIEPLSQLEPETEQLEGPEETLLLEQGEHVRRRV